MLKIFIIALVICLPVVAQSTQAPTPITASGRLKWFTYSTVGPPTLIAGLVPSALGTLTNRPKEYGTHWDGFGKRYALRFTGSSTGNAMEASLGALWGEDPRYYRASSGASFGNRFKNALKQTFVTHDRNGNAMPAYARYAAIPGGNFIANSWRPESEATVTGALLRTGLGFLDRFASNVFSEFRSDLTRRKK